MTDNGDILGGSIEDALHSVAPGHGAHSSQELKASSESDVMFKSRVPKKQSVRSHTNTRERAPTKALKPVILSSNKPGASHYEVNNSDWVLSESLLLGAIVYDIPHPIEQTGRLKMVIDIKDENSIVIRWMRTPVLRDGSSWHYPTA